MIPEFESSGEHFLNLGKEQQDCLVEKILEESAHREDGLAVTKAQIRKALKIGIEPSQILPLTLVELCDLIAKTVGSYDKEVKELARLSGVSEEIVIQKYKHAIKIFHALQNARAVKKAQEKHGVFPLGASVIVTDKKSKRHGTIATVVRQDPHFVVVRFFDGQRSEQLMMSYGTVKLAEGEK